MRNWGAFEWFWIILITGYLVVAGMIVWFAAHAHPAVVTVVIK